MVYHTLSLYSFSGDKRVIFFTLKLHMFIRSLPSHQDIVDRIPSLPTVRMGYIIALTQILKPDRERERDRERDSDSERDDVKRDVAHLNMDLRCIASSPKRELTMRCCHFVL